MPIVSSTRPKPEVNVLDKRIPRNPKYENIQPTIDTGDSVTKVLQRNEELRAAGKQQTDEIFKRMKVSTLVKIIIQVAEINSLETPKNYENDGVASRKTLVDSYRSQIFDDEPGPITSRSTLQSVISGVGEMDVYQRYIKQMTAGTPPTPKTAQSDRTHFDPEDRPYLIVDLRDQDDFQTNHIVSAHHYPAAMLSRCTNNESKELLLYKNQKGKIIIIYDDDEHIAPRAATIMVERGYNNVFLLSGGLKYAVRKFPRGLITGRCQLAWTLPHTLPTPSRKSKRSESMDTARHEVPIGQSIPHVPRPAPGPMVTFEERENFTVHDIEDLNTQLEANLQPTDSGTRLSRAQTQASKQSSRVSNVSDRTHYSHISDKPWKP